MTRSEMVGENEWVVARKTPVLKSAHLYNIFFAKLTDYRESFFPIFWKIEN